MATILTKKSDTSSSVPLAADLTNAAGGAELAVNTADKRLYSKTSGGSVVELGTNPSALSLPNGTANGVPYLNGSKVLTSGSALTFDGTSLGLGRSAAFLSGAGIEVYRNGVATLRLSNVVSGQENQVELSAETNGPFRLNSLNSKDFAWAFASSEQMRLTSTGLGIGTSSPSEKLTVNGGLVVNGSESLPNGTSGVTIGFDTTNLIGNIYALTAGVAWRDLAIRANQTIFFGGGSERMRLDSSGNLGLGVTPSAWDSVFKSFDGGGSGCFGSLFFQANGDYTTALGSNLYYNGGWKYKATAAAGKYELKNNTHAWYTAPSGTAGNAISFTQAMTLDASGNLFVAQTGRAEQNSNSFSFDVLAKAAYVNHASGTSTGNGYVNFGYNAVNIGSISQNGTTGVLYNLTSDYRLKNNPTALNGSGEFIDALQPKTWDWWDGSGKGVGFIAHEFMEVAKYSGNGTKDAVDKDGKPVYQSIQPSSSEVMANLVAEIQSLRKRLAALESK